MEHKMRSVAECCCCFPSSEWWQEFDQYTIWLCVRSRPKF